MIEFVRYMLVLSAATGILAGICLTVIVLSLS